MALIPLQQYSKSESNTWVSFKSFTKELTKELTSKINFHKRPDNKNLQSCRSYAYQYHISNFKD